MLAHAIFSKFFAVIFITWSHSSIATCDWHWSILWFRRGSARISLFMIRKKLRRRENTLTNTIKEFVHSRMLLVGVLNTTKSPAILKYHISKYWGEWVMLIFPKTLSGNVFRFWPAFTLPSHTLNSLIIILTFPSESLTLG